MACSPTKPQARTHATVVSSTDELVGALRTARLGDTLALRPGDYAPVIKDFHGQVTITSADPRNPAVFRSLTVRGSSGLTIDHVTFSTEGFPAEAYGAAGTVPFKIAGSSNITLSNLDVHGSPQGSLDTDESGISVRNSDHVTVADNNFHNLHFAFLHLDDQFLTIRHNELHDLRDDGIRGGGSSNVLIDGNHCHNNHPDGDLDKDHPDCIQFWTSNTTASAHDITIVANRYERENGHATQFIFLGNEKHIPYQHVVIQDNVARGPLWNAIAVFYAHDVTIKNNRLESLCAPESGQTNVAWIRTKEIDGLTMLDNLAGSYMDQGGNTAVTAARNAKHGCVR